MEPAQLLTYLRSLRADDIQKIEVVPTTGADYDADSSGGIIRITLRKRRENGVEGSLSADSRLAGELREALRVDAASAAAPEGFKCPGDFPYSEYLYAVGAAIRL